MGEYGMLFSWQSAVIYLIIINVIGFFAMWIDKVKAKRG